MRAFIVKNGDFVLQEQFVMQLLTQFNHIFEETGLPLRLRTYRIMALNHDCGFIEYMHNTISIDKLKSRTPNFSTLAEFFKRTRPRVRLRAQLTPAQASGPRRRRTTRRATTS